MLIREGGYLTKRDQSSCIVGNVGSVFFFFRASKVKISSTSILILLFKTLSLTSPWTLWKWSFCFYTLCHGAVIVHGESETAQTLLVLLTRGDIYSPPCTPLKLSPFSCWALGGWNCQVEKEGRLEKMLINACCYMGFVPVSAQVMAPCCLCEDFLLV